MKKFFSLLTVLMASTAMMAQWTKPVPQTALLATDGTVHYLYNVDAQAFMVGANDWDTRVSVAEDKGWQVKISPAIDPETEEPNGHYVIEDCVESRDNQWKYMWATSWDVIYTDYASQGVQFYNTWNVLPIEGTNNFELTLQALIDVDEPVADEEPVKPAGKLGVAEIFRGGKGNTRTWFWVEGLTYDDPVANEEEGIEAVSHPMFDGKFMTTWALVTEEEYAAWKPLYDTYAAAVSLKKAIDEAAEAYEGIDLSAPLAVYNNTASTEEELKAAQESIKDIIAAYIESNLANATLSKPIEITGKLANLLPANDNDLNASWTRIFTGNGTVGVFHINTWSGEGESDGTNMLTPFIEDWIGRGSILSDQKFFCNAQTVLPGAYKIVANVRLYNESEGATQNEGAYLTGNINRTALLGQEGSKQDYYNGMLYYWNPEFETYTIVGNSGQLAFGIQIENANFNWVAAKDFRVFYCGDNEEAINYAREHTEMTCHEVEGDVYAQKELLNAYTSAYDDYQNASSAEAVKAAVETLAELEDSLQANINAYAAYAAKVEAYVDGINSGEYNYNGDLWAEFCDLVLAEMENTVEAGDLSTTEIIAKGKELDDMFAVAVKASLTQGSDCTNMIVNANFSDGFNGWVKPGAGNVGNFAGLTPAVPNNVEVFENVVDIYQDVEGVPDGIYSISVKAFERPAGNGNYDGTEPSKVFLYMNDFRTPVQNICKDAMPEEEAIDGENCYITRGYTSGAGNDLLDYLTDFGYVPNGMVGAAVAFKAGRYEQKTYGLVEGGKMRIGLTSDGQKAHWVLWADFRLTFEGKSAEAVASVLEDILPGIKEYWQENKGLNLSAPIVDKLEKAIDAAEEAVSDGDGEVMFQALKGLNAAYAEAQANYTEMQSVAALYDEFNQAADYTDYDEQLAAKWDEYYEVFDDMLYLNYTSEELTQFVNDVKALIKALQDAYDLAMMEERMDEIDFASASDSNPVDATDVIINPNIDGNINGWTLDLITYTNQGYQSASYINEDVTYEDIYGDDVNPTCAQFIEVWRSGNEPILGDIYQKIMLPAGTYTLGADVIASYQLGGTTKDDVKGCYLFAGNSRIEVATENGKPEHFELTFKLTEEKNVIAIGINCSNETTANWLAADNFSLLAYGTNSTKPVTGEENAISSLAGNTQNTIFTITGVRVNKVNKPGLYIINGAKVLVK